MPNIAQALKEEIARLAKKEAKRLLAPAAEHFSGLKKSVSELKRKIMVLESKVERLEKKTASGAKGIKLPAPEALDKLRLGPSNVLKLRTKLELSRGEMAALLGVSQNSIFLWEKGEAKPRDAAKAKIISLRGLGKRKIRKMLESLGAAKPAKDAQPAASAEKLSADELP